LGAIPCGAFEVLVLGDEPLQSIFAGTAQEIVIVRWVSCVTKARADEVIASVPRRLPIVGEAVEFSVIEPRLCLFDAALDTPLSTDSELHCIDVIPGRYSITTESHKREQEFDFLIHRFRRQIS
jgi:hypothetical protein